jgi:hypothetical protein
MSTNFASARAGLWQALHARSGLADLQRWSGERVEARHGGWRVVLDSYRVPIERFDHTRMVVVLPDSGFRFRIYEPHALSWVGTLMGLLDIEIGDEQFDRKWVIKSNSRSRIRELLSDADLRRRIDALDHCALSLEDDMSRVDPERPEGERRAELVLALAELHTSEPVLQKMFELIAGTLERLEALAAKRAD